MLKGTLEEQIKAEEQCKEEAIQDFIQKNTSQGEEGRLDLTSHGEILVKLGYDVFKAKLDEYFEAPLRSHTLKTRQFLLMMCDDTKVLAYLVLAVVVGRLAGDPVSLTSMSKSIVQRLSELYFFDRLKADNPKLHSYLGKEYRKAGRARKRQLIKKHIEALKYDNLLANKAGEVTRLGTTLLHILIKSGANIVEIHNKHMRGKKAMKVVALSKEASNVMVDMYYRNVRFNVRPSYAPMIYPPKDWEEIRGGGYYTANIPLFIGKKSISRKFFYDKDITSLLPVVNKAQQVAWRVNTRVVDVIDDVFKANLIDYTQGGTLPRCYGGLPTSNVYTTEDLISREQYEDFHTWNKAREKLQIELDSENGRRLSIILALDTAQQMMDYESIYFPYQFDYRGRLYPHTSHLNPQAPKHIKSMLEFSKGEVLNDEGIKWLKIHIANVYGLDKEPFESRIKWTEAHSSTILAIASDPLEFIKDWAYCDSPFEFLAACFAYEDSTKGLPIYLPIQLDATCSGIQFYSGLLLDKEGAESVNVIGNNRQDIYQKVADKVNDYLSEGEYPKEIEFKDSEGVERTTTTRIEAASLQQRWEIINVPDDYQLKEGEEWVT